MKLRSLFSFFLMVAAISSLAAIEESNITQTVTVSTNDRVRLNTASGLTRLATVASLQSALSNFPAISAGTVVADNYEGDFGRATNLTPGAIRWQPSLVSLGSSNLAVAFLGDSWIYGGASGQKPYAAGLLTNRFYSGRVADCTNAAADGAGLAAIWGQWTNGGVKAWTEAQIALGRTVHVHLEGGINIDGYSYPSNHVLVYSNFCRDIRATGAKVVAYTIPAYDSGETTMAGSWADQFRQTKNALVRELCDESRVRLWDFLIDLGAWLTWPYGEPYKAGDSVHLSEPYGWLEMARFADGELWRGAHRERVGLVPSSGTIAFPVLEGDTLNTTYPAGTINWQRDSTNVAFLSAGTNQPEGVIPGHVGSLYLTLSDGSVWSKTSGDGNTGWALVGSGSPTNLILAANGALKISSPTWTTNNYRPALIITNTDGGSSMSFGDVGYAWPKRTGIQFIPGTEPVPGWPPNHNQTTCGIFGDTNLTAINVPSSGGLIQFARAGASVLAGFDASGSFYVSGALSVSNGPATTAWSGPTNSIAVAWPWRDYTLYAVGSDCEITNITGWASGQRKRASIIFTNAATSNCTVRLPASWWRYGSALASASVTLTNGGKMFKLDVEASGVTNVIGAFAQ